ncbi:hypothetical protein ACFLTH_12945 [Bacteroidota bacterium]
MKEKLSVIDFGIRGKGLGYRQHLKWKYYLSYCEAAFDMRNISVVQLIYSRPNNRNL